MGGMKEFTAPGEVHLSKQSHVVQPVLDHASRTPDKPLLAYRQGDRFVDVTAREFADQVERLARGLIALGVQPGDRVALMSATRIEWVYLDYAIMSAGAVTVPIYDTSSQEQVEWILSDSGAAVAFFETPALKAMYDQAADGLPTKHVFVVTEGGLAELERHGADVEPAEVRKRTDALTTDDLATLIYTSGTTGRPKGCMLTHGNLRWDVVQTASITSRMLGPDDSQLLFLPLAHSFAKVLLLTAIELGVKVGFATSTDALVEEFSLFRPTYIAAVPRIFEKVFSMAQQRAHADGKGKIFDRAADVAAAFSQASQRGRVPLGLRLQHALFDKLVYGKLRAVFGGQLRASSSGGGPLGARLCHFFHGVGIEVYEGYGLTETSPILTTNYPDMWKIGTVGRPIPGTTIRIDDDGEILAKGGQIFAGYYANEQATKDAIDADGWFHTGDLGELDADGFVTITGRKKEIIVTAGGKNVAPAVLEDRLRSHALVSQAIVVGDNRPYIGALVTIDPEQFPAWAKQHAKEGKSVAELVDDPELRATVQQAVDHANAAVSRAESIRQFAILPHDFAIETGELTPTLKVKRNVVADRYDALIERLYGT